MIVTPDKAPPIGCMGGSIHSWERGKSPWHRDAFPDEFKDRVPEQGLEPILGWYGLDWCGNQIAWVPDGTPLTDPKS